MMPLILAAAAIALGSGLGDGDNDGIADELEQRLLIRFQPRFLVSAGDCATAPAEFVPGIASPTVKAANGTIYGQAFPTAGGIELHYYHLWSRDCGRRGHPLDAEHVSVLLKHKGQSDFQARYWYAAAHEDTLCDVSSAARAEDLKAVEDRPEIWISRGKHASFLRYDLCGGGCGAERCDRPKALAVARIVNIGEHGAPLNGAAWVASSAWPLAAKMESDFSPEVIDAIERAPAGGVIVANRTGGVQRTVSAGNISLDKTAAGTSRAADRTSGAVGAGRQHAGDAVSRSAGAVRRSLLRVWSAVSGR